MTYAPVPSEGAIYPDPSDPWLPGLLKPLVAIPTALAAAAAGAGAFLQSGLGPAVSISAAIVAAALVVLAVIDWQTHRLPDVIVLPLYAVAALPAIYAAANGDITLKALGTALAAMAALYVFWWCLAAFSGAIGFGDVKLAGVLGLALGVHGGFEAVTGGFVLPCLMGGAVAASMLITGKRNAEIAFGPYLAMGTLLVLLMPDVITPYVRFGLF